MLPEDLARIGEIIGDAAKTAQVVAIIQAAERQERQQRRQKQCRGIAAARERGVQFGRPPMAYPAAFPQIYRQQQDGLLSVTSASRQLGISRQQFYRLRQRYQAENPR